MMIPTDSIQLPLGNHPDPIRFLHFPTTLQAVVWRNWELVPVERLATVLRTTSETILKLAGDLGLRLPPVVNSYWLERGYVTLIRNNWHLLPYEQLLELLGWSAEKMAYTLREEDFLWVKLGCLKPNCEPVYYAPLNSEQISRTAEIRRWVEKHFSDSTLTAEEPSFTFVDKFKLARADRPVIAPSSRFDLRLVYPYFALSGAP